MIGDGLPELDLPRAVAAGVTTAGISNLGAFVRATSAAANALDTQAPRPIGHVLTSLRKKRSPNHRWLAACCSLKPLRVRFFSNSHLERRIAQRASNVNTFPHRTFQMMAAGARYTASIWNPTSPQSLHCGLGHWLSQNIVSGETTAGSELGIHTYPRRSQD